MWSDASVEAAARLIARYCEYDPDAPSDGPGYEVPVWMHFREQARETLAAAEAAAWSTDMEAAPHDGSDVWLYHDGRSTIGSVSYTHLRAHETDS